VGFLLPPSARNKEAAKRSPVCFDTHSLVRTSVYYCICLMLRSKDMFSGIWFLKCSNSSAFTEQVSVSFLESSMEVQHIDLIHYLRSESAGLSVEWD